MRAMCLMLYLASATEQPTFASSDLKIGPIDPRYGSVPPVFTLPWVRFVGAHTGCSCGFPYVIAEQPFEYYEGMFADSEDRCADLTSLRTLLPIVAEQVRATGSAEMYPVWNGEETLPAKGRITMTTNELDADRFFFIERFLYRIVRL
jgi:hypothetical protein